MDYRLGYISANWERTENSKRGRVIRCRFFGNKPKMLKFAKKKGRKLISIIGLCVNYYA